MKQKLIVLIVFVIFVAILFVFGTHVNIKSRSRASFPDRQARGYLESASTEIANTLIEIGDHKIITKNPNFIESIDSHIASSPNFSFPSSFLSRGVKDGVVVSGFIRSDYRKYSFEMAALWRENVKSEWHKISLIRTLDKDVIWESKELVDSQWIEENLIPFPSPQSATFRMIEKFNREKIEKENGDRLE
jgi:hypothetical protein